MSIERETPARRATAAGVDRSEEMDRLSLQYRAHLAPLAMADWAKEIGSRLDRAGSLGWAYGAMCVLDKGDAILIAEGVLGGAHYPLPAFMSPMDDARWWASMANEEERKAYTLAGFKAMKPHNQDAFLEYVQKQGAA